MIKKKNYAAYGRVWMYCQGIYMVFDVALAPLGTALTEEQGNF